ncbi:MAG: hypothetical protein KDB31_00620, partial [Microthrixaceae bacterium]|nr:hypothetical protein [Microthrixaceae bacterium]
MRTDLTCTRAVVAFLLAPVLIVGALVLPAAAGEPELVLSLTPSSAVVPWGGAQPLTVTATNVGNGVSGYAGLDETVVGVEFSCQDRFIPGFQPLAPGESAQLECSAGPVTADSSVTLELRNLDGPVAPSVSVPLFVEGGPPLELQVSPAAADVQPGEDVVFDVVATNSSPAVVDDVVVESRVPSCAREFDSLSPGDGGAIAWQCTAAWGSDFSGPFTQFFEATGTSRLAVVGDVSSHADVEVSVAGEAPSLADAELTLTPASQDVGYNAEATITMAFTNTGDVPLSRIDGNTRNADDQGAVGIGCSFLLPYDFELRPGETVSKRCTEALTADVALVAGATAAATTTDDTCEGEPSLSFPCTPGQGTTQTLNRVSNTAVVTVGGQAIDMQVAPLPNLESMGNSASSTPPVGEPQELAVFIRNRTGNPLPEVVVDAPGSSDCTRSVGAVGTGPAAVVGYTCTVTPEEIGAEFDEWSGTTFESTFEAKVVSGADDGALDLVPVSITPETSLEVTVGSNQLEVPYGSGATIAVTVTNPTSKPVLEPRFGADPYWGTVTGCDEELEVLQPGASVELECNFEPPTELNALGSAEWPSGTYSLLFFAGGWIRPCQSCYLLPANGYGWTNVKVAQGPLALEVSPPRQEVAPGAAAAFDVSVVNTGASAISEVSLTTGYQLGGAVQFADCARDLGTISPGAKVDFTCSGSDFTPSLPTTFFASGNVAGIPHPVRSAAEVTVWEVDAERPPFEFAVELGPEFQQVAPGEEAIVTARVSLPEELTSSPAGNATLELRYDGLRSCDTSRPVAASQVPDGVVEFTCAVSEGVDFNGDLTTSVSLLARTTLGNFKSYTYIAQSNEIGIAVAAPGIGVDVTADPSSVVDGASTELEVTVTNTTGSILAGAVTNLVELVPGYFDSYGASTSRSECMNELPVLSPGESTTFSCVVPMNNSSGSPAGSARELVVLVNGYLEEEVASASAGGPVLLAAPAGATLVSGSGSASVVVTPPTEPTVAVEIEGPSEPVSSGEPVEFTVTVSHSLTGTWPVAVDQALQLWSLEAPDCNRRVGMSELEPSSLGVSFTYTCSALAGTDLGDGEAVGILATAWHFVPGDDGPGYWVPSESASDSVVVPVSGGTTTTTSTTSTTTTSTTSTTVPTSTTTTTVPTTTTTTTVPTTTTTTTTTAPTTTTTTVPTSTTTTTTGPPTTTT